MPRISTTLPEQILAAIKKEARQKELPVSAMARLIIAQHIWRKKHPKDKQHWLEAIYSGKARRKIKKLEDWFSN